MWSLHEVSKHNNAKSCWVIIKSKVYDVTDFLPEHPGGASIILKYAGKDATSVYEPIHPPDALDTSLPSSKHLGDINTEAAAALNDAQENKKKTLDELRVEAAMKQRPPLSRILSLADMEEVARKVLSHKALAYYSSATDDEITNSENARAFTRFFFNARVLRPVSKCDVSTKILGFYAGLPIFVSGAALAKLGHPKGEVNITRGVGNSAIQMVSSNASLSPAEIVAAAAPDQTLFFQLYKSSDDVAAEKRVRDMEKLGFKAIFLTVDAVVPSNRERDIRAPWLLEAQEGVVKYFQEGAAEEEANILGTAGGLIMKDDRDMTFAKTIPWLRSITKLPIVLKGIQCVEDAVLASDAGVDGILLSNHGGRQLEYSMPPLEVLYKLRKQRPDIFDRLEVYIDGGVRRGTDVLKALCLGAKAVGLGRPFLYAQSAYGEDGVRKICSILRTEILSAMQFLGASRVADLTPDLVERIDWQPIERSRL